MNDFNPDNEKHMEIVQETEQAMKEEAERQMSEDYPKLKNGNPDFMQMVDDMFPNQLAVASYVKGMLKGYAFHMSIQSIENLLTETEKNGKEVRMFNVIPEEIRPDNEDKVTSTDIN